MSSTRICPRSLVVLLASLAWILLSACSGDRYSSDGSSPDKSDPAAYTRAVVEAAIERYDAAGLDATVAYHSSQHSVDGQWYVFIIDDDGYTIAHPNPAFLGRDPSERVDSTGYFYGDELTGAPAEGRWVSYVLLNPETGDERQKHTWAVRHDGYVFASGWYED